MPYKNCKIIRGQVLYVENHHAWKADGRELLHSADAGQSWRVLGVLPIKFGLEFLTAHPLGRRLGRVGIHHLAFTRRTSATLIAHRHIFRLNLERGEIERISPLGGSRPLTVCSLNGRVYYGEYRSNPERGVVKIWQSNLNGEDWQPAWSFKNIRHVHGVFHDPYENALWVTTGDLDHEAGIWRTDDDFATLQKVAGGSQRFRAIQLLFTREHVYFGSDAPDEKNHIFRMDREGKNVEELAAVGSSVFHGCKVGDHLFFSTAVEPSRVNTTRHAEVWGSADGKNWHVVRRFKKDIWPMKYFQYGQVLFPAGPGDGKNLWMTPFATEGDLRTVRVAL